MIVLGFNTKQSQKEIFVKATEYFVDKVGLIEIERENCCLRFADENDIGYVNVMFSENYRKSEVEVESREYDYHAKKFVNDVK